MMAPQNDRAFPVGLRPRESDGAHRDAPPDQPVRPLVLPREISSKLRQFGIDLVRHIVVASIVDLPPDDPDEPDGQRHLPPPFPPSNGCGLSIINLLTTDRATLTMRRLVTKALLDKAPTLAATVRSLQRIPEDVVEFRNVFDAVVEQMVNPAEPVVPDDEPGDREPTAPTPARGSWGKLVTAFAFGVRLIKGFVDQRHHEGRAIELDVDEWGAAMGDVLAERMGPWIWAQGGWNVGFNDFFVDARGLEETITKNLFLVFVLGIGVVVAYKSRAFGLGYFFSK